MRLTIENEVIQIQQYEKETILAFFNKKIFFYQDSLF